MKKILFLFIIFFNYVIAMASCDVYGLYYYRQLREMNFLYTDDECILKVKVLSASFDSLDYCNLKVKVLDKFEYGNNKFDTIVSLRSKYDKNRNSFCFYFEIPQDTCYLRCYKQDSIWLWNPYWLNNVVKLVKNDKVSGCFTSLDAKLEYIYFGCRTISTSRFEKQISRRMKKYKKLRDEKKDKKKALKFAKKLKRRGYLDNSKISKYSGISIEEIEKL